jgi:hypothetical protein
MKIKNETKVHRYIIVCALAHAMAPAFVLAQPAGVLSGEIRLGNPSPMNTRRLS